ncbi:c-type cytochrome [Heliobacterium chlorum]|uniref:C-type cytochrome n=1 Tax=Heliobacterium chlorum TaxID=2698 RepID=A0ABR7T2W6_HELCL|nr:c-type cytochrome [Heliobacterium chlorum]MBC9784209.1 c-type cytochrome [Heliobacterium chlorum]
MGTRKLIMFGGTAVLLVGILLAPSLQAKGELVRGHELYKTNCASCHGEDGKGVKGVKAATLNNEGFLKIASDDYILKSMRAGRFNQNMTAFDHTKIPDEKAQLIIKNIRSWRPDIQPQELKNERIVGDPVKGEAYYKQVCAACHGPNGEGGIGSSITDPGFLNAATDEFILKSVTTGRPGTSMPAYPDTQELRNTISFLRSKQIPLDVAQENAEKKKAEEKAAK